MHERERRLTEGSGPDGSARRALTAQHPLLFLQRTAGNAAVSRLVAGMHVQRLSDEEIELAILAGTMGPIFGWNAVVAGKALADIYGEAAGTEDAQKNPEEFPNAPAEEPGEGPEEPEPEWQEPGPLPEPEGPGGGPAPGPGGPTGPGPSAGPGRPGGIPGMEPVTPGGGAGPGGIPGIEPVPPGGGAGPAGARPMLRRGSTGEAVREAQGLLVRHGATLTPDGQFGPLTQRAVIDFQRSAGLTPDGIVGPRTWSALEAG